MSLNTKLNSSIGAKTVMAVSGILLMLFVLGHMLGNLQVFLGPDALNAYAAKLQGLGPLLWVVRLGLLGILLAHVFAAIKVWRQTSAARPIPYQRPGSVQTTLAAKSMLLTGALVVAFLVWHLLHFTVVTSPELAQLKHPAGADAHHPDVYAMVVAGFSHGWVSILYIVSQVLLGVHLSHGASSLFQTLGLRGAGKEEGRTDLFAKGFAGLVVVGNCSIPVSVLLFGLGEEYLHHALQAIQTTVH